MAQLLIQKTENKNTLYIIQYTVYSIRVFWPQLNNEYTICKNRKQFQFIEDSI